MIKIANILKKSSSIFIVLLLFCAFTYAQNPLKQGNRLFKEKKYCDAIKQYDQYLKYYANKKAFLKRGISNYNCNHLDNAIEDLNNALLLGSYNNDLYLFLARSYQAEQDFENAIIYYKKYLSYIGKNIIKRKTITDNIKKCTNGIYLQYAKSNHFIENWGIEINTPSDDILPLQSPSNPTIFYFSSNRNNNTHNLDTYNIFQVEYNNGNWQKLHSISNDMPSANNIILDFYNDGMQALSFSGNIFNKGNIFAAAYSPIEEKVTFSNKIEGQLNAKTGFKYIQAINDSTFIFSSNKYGGYGGYDIFITGIRQGKWFDPINLGPAINTSYDEISPFVTKDGLTLYFSSNNMNSVGGFDIFKSNFSYSENDWLKPVNFGLPANSSANDYGFRILASGNGAIYNSDRRDMGAGKNDIYWIHFKENQNITDSYTHEIPFLENRNFSFDNKVLAVNKYIKKQYPDTKYTSKTEILNKKIKTKPGEQINTTKKEFTLPYIFFKNNKFCNNKKTVDIIDKLAKLMILNPQIKIEFIGNCFNWEKENSELSRSVKFAESIADSMKLRMISPDRIIIKGVGDNIPAAKPNGPLRSKNIIKKINNRIEIYILNADTLPYIFKKDNLYLSKSLEAPAHLLYKAIVDGLTYRIQIYKSDSLVINDVQNKYPDSSIEKDLVSNKYIYTVGLFKEYSMAKELYKKLLKENLKDIKIIPYINDIEIPENKLLIYAKQYLDLVNYLEDKNKYLDNGNK